MHILVLGAAGMLGRKLVQRLAADRFLNGTPIRELHLADVVAPSPPASAPFPVSAEACDLADAAVAARLVARRPEVIVHLAAVVSGDAEENFERGYRVNLHGALHLFEAVRAAGEGYCPRVVFASSLAVYGAPLPDPVPDDHRLTPFTSYGTQKAIGELLLADYSRRGVLDGVGLRLPTICVRPGRPNKAASGFFSSIIREPLNGEEAVLPVSEDTTHWFASPRAAVGFLVHAVSLSHADLQGDRNLTMPGVAASVGEQIEALRRVAGEAAVRRIRREPNDRVARIIAGWPRSFEARRARQLGFIAEASFDDIVQVYIADELGRSAAA